uniref:Extracellular matrix protein FRAS1 n=1 Tax=Lygus hesperus TaxID=30085 RepID=A0A0A9X6P7_LYGHE
MFEKLLLAVLFLWWKGTSGDTIFCSNHNQVLDKPADKWCHKCLCDEGVLKCRGGRLCPSLRYFDPPTQMALKMSADLRFYEKQLMTMRVVGIEICDRRVQSLAP